jgi:DNA-directed RNA polymerase subunit RPC12/RpoP
MQIVCSKCGALLWNQPDAADREYLCARCGGKPPIAEITASDAAIVRETRSKIDERRDPSRAPHRTTVFKDDVTRATGRRSDRKYVVDRERGLYEETVKDQASGQSIYHKRQSLKDKNRGKGKRGNRGDAA